MKGGDSQTGWWCTVTWYSSSPLSHYALPNSYIHNELGLFDLAKVTTGILVSVQ